MISSGWAAISHQSRGSQAIRATCKAHAAERCCELTKACSLPHPKFTQPCMPMSDLPLALPHQKICCFMRWHLRSAHRSPQLKTNRQKHFNTRGSSTQLKTAEQEHINRNTQASQDFFVLSCKCLRRVTMAVFQADLEFKLRDIHPCIALLPPSTCSAIASRNAHAR